MTETITLLHGIDSIAAARTAPMSREEASGAGATILVCDDHEDIVDMLVSVLELEGFTPIAAHCGTEALAIVQHHTIDLVLLDKAMPDVDGFEVCRRIKAMFPLRFLPVIMVTAKAHKEDKLAGLELGADDYITKPFDVEEIVAKVRVMLRIKRVEDQLYQRNIELASFNAVAGVIGESLILEEMLHNSLSEILRLMSLPCGWIYLQNEQGGDAHLAAYLGIDTSAETIATLSSAAVDALAAGTNATDHHCAWLAPAFRQQHGLHSCVSIPLKAKQRLVGLMCLASRQQDAFRPYSSDLQVLESLGFELGIAIEHALLYRDVQERVERLREIDRLKSQFISTASHEFRTPLSIIKGFANLLLRSEEFGFDRETEKEYLRLIDGQTGALAGLVADMLDASRIESGYVDVQARAIDLADLIARTVPPLAQQGRDRGMSVTIETQPGLLVHADPRHVEQVISNLLSNAIKYSDDGSKITIRASLMPSGAEARIDVIDEGVGIAPEHMPRLFERFSRLENRRSVEAGGTGLGLYIARNWVEANGGRIWVDSMPEQGSTFSFTLPIVVAVAPCASLPSSSR